MRARYGDRIKLYTVQRRTRCGECGRIIERYEPRYEAELRGRTNFNPYWTNTNANRHFELSRLVCEECKNKLISPSWGMRLINCAED